MNSTGKLPPPGSAGGTMANDCTPGMAEIFPCTSGTILNAVRLRSSQGLRPSPQKPPVGKVIWKVNCDSGTLTASLWIMRVDGMIWSSVELAGDSRIPKMIPWSSAGASSFADCPNISKARTPITTQET